MDDSLRKTAILLAAMDAPLVDSLLARMPEETAARLRSAILELGPIQDHEERLAIDDFLRDAPAGGHGADPRVGGAAEHVVKYRHFRAAATPGVELELSGQAPDETPAEEAADATPFQFLHEARGDKLRPILDGEHPQTIAMVVSHLPAERAAEALDSLPSDVQADVLRRLVQLDGAHPEIVREVERGLQTRIVRQVRDERRRDTGLTATRSILAAADPGVRRRILSNLAQRDTALAEQLTRDRIGFADLQWLSDASWRTVIATIDSQVMILALAGATPALAERVLGLLPQAEARLLRGALDTLGPTRLSDVEQSQADVVAQARRLASRGQIDLPPVQPSRAA